MPRYSAGATGPGARASEVVDAARRFHAALAGIRCPDLLATRTHRWALVDRIAWGDACADLGPVGRRLMASREPLHLQRQLAYCDLDGNVLLHDSAPPAAIDLSLYWRPAPYADVEDAPEHVGERTPIRAYEQLADLLVRP